MVGGLALASSDRQEHQCPWGDKAQAQLYLEQGEPPTSGRGSSICLGGWADTCSLSSEGPQARFICGPVSPGWASCAGTSWLVGRHLYPTDASSTPSCRMSSDLASGPAYSVLRGQRL